MKILLKYCVIIGKDALNASCCETWCQNVTISAKISDFYIWIGF